MDGVQITTLRRLDADAALDSKGRQVPFIVFALELSNGHVWYVFSSHPIDLVLSDDRRRVESARIFAGVLRVALAPTQDAFPYLIDSAAVFPTGGAVKYKVDAAKDVATVEFQWRTRRLDGTASLEGAQLMMLALPHHVDAMDKSANTLLSDVRYTSIRGMMTGVTGDVWRMTESLPAIEWDYKDDGLFRADLPPSQAETAADARRRIVESLRRDVAASAQPLSGDSYNFGKLIGRDARLLLTAARFEQQDLVTTMLEKMKRELTPWLTGANPNALLYDRTFGGVVTTDGLRDSAADFGNGRYNDHHFHYGYFVYALAVVRKFDAAFIDAHASAVAMLMGDFGAPLDRETAFFGDFPALEYFPTARHKDWFVGHSYASGLFPIQDGKSQESSSEAVNAYYALSLFASLDKNKDDQKAYVHYARVLLALEMRATKTYWHMRENSQVYEPTFARNAMVGVVGDMSVAYNTWFSSEPYHIHGINLMPVTPITSQLLSEEYVAREYEVIRGAAMTLDGDNNLWKSLLVMDNAIIDAPAAWKDLTTSVNAFDPWNSRTNALYWVATRPSWRQPVPRFVPGTDKNQCFGAPACGVAGANGTALQCCGTLPGCCPSGLGCCPQRERPATPLPNVCFGEPQCAALGLGCCNSAQGCCEPDPVTGIVLGCCKPKSRRPTTPQTQPPVVISDPATCHRQPRCAAAKLDCCGSPQGCCQPNPLTGQVLDCCDAVPATVAPKPTPTPTSTECTVIEENVDYSGADVGAKPSKTAEGCCAICRQQSGCKAFSWNDYNGGTCWLKSAKGSATPRAGTRSGVVGDVDTPVTVKPPTSNEQIEEGVDYHGNDVGSASAANAELCFGLCRQRSGCKAFSWNGYNGGTCWLKSGKGATSKQAGTRSGVVSQTTTDPVVVVDPSKPTIEEGVDYHGNDVGSASASAAESCVEICRQRAGCKAFSWNDFNGGTCWLKSGKGASSAKAGTRSSVISFSTIDTFEPGVVTPKPTIEEGVDYHGNDVGSAGAANAELCFDICRQRSGCKAFSWNDYNGGTCWLKHSKGATSARAGTRSAVVA
ncbi:hypothetical protein PINS_up006855 [Pythium insidiosum]|nr:hypothetical protein PINS_up006855 [Pythium insidiosum]